MGVEVKVRPEVGVVIVAGVVGGGLDTLPCSPVLPELCCVPPLGGVCADAGENTDSKPATRDRQASV